MAYVPSDAAGDLSQAFAVYGSISFDGNGNYSIDGDEFDSNNQVQQPFSVAGTYTISASGMGFLDNPISSGDTIFGLVANGIFLGSSTDNTSGFNDLFIAAPMTSSAVASGVFKGPYAVSLFSPGGSAANTADAFFQINPDGQGHLGNVSITGYFGGTTSTVTQNSSSIKYIISNGAANVMFPNSQNAAFIAGNEYLYPTPDGNFVFGGSPFGFDMLVGVHPLSGATSADFSGLYYNAGVDEDTSQLGNGSAILDTYYGALVATNGDVVGHQRILSTGPTDFTYADVYSVNSDGSYDDNLTSTHYVVGTGGIRVGYGIGPFLGLSVAVKAPTVSGQGVFISPQGVVNAASSAPFTASIAPGELITLYGSNMSNTAKVAKTAPLPTSLGQTEVFINGVKAPIYVVSPGQISALVPYGLGGTVAQIQVLNNGKLSNIVTQFVGQTAPGVFTSPAGGLGLGAVLHQNFSKVTDAHPAAPGETIQIFLTGLGAVFPTIADGAVGPSGTLSKATNAITAFIGGESAKVTYAGLAPELAALYQLNVTIPSDLAAGDYYLNVSGPDSYTSEAILPVGGSNAAADELTTAAPSERARSMRGRGR